MSSGGPSPPCEGPQLPHGGAATPGSSSPVLPVSPTSPASVPRVPPPVSPLPLNIPSAPPSASSAPLPGSPAPPPSISSTPHVSPSQNAPLDLVHGLEAASRLPTGLDELGHLLLHLGGTQASGGDPVSGGNTQVSRGGPRGLGMHPLPLQLTLFLNSTFCRFSCSCSFFTRAACSGGTGRGQDPWVPPAAPPLGWG